MNPMQRAHYDTTGRVRRGADEDFLESFNGGAFKDPLLRQKQEAAASALSDQIILRQEEGARQSHTAGFEVSEWVGRWLWTD